MTVHNNEEVYDEKIAPLMRQIEGVCRDNGIPMTATFEYSPDEVAYHAIHGAAANVDARRKTVATIQSATLVEHLREALRMYGDIEGYMPRAVIEYLTEHCGAGEADLVMESPRSAATPPSS